MRARPSLIISPLSADHQKAAFRCGTAALDVYLHKQAGQDVKRRVSRVFVTASTESPDVVLGYYTLSSLSIDCEQFPDRLARKLPRHPIPAALLGRLAISESSQGQGIGGLLLVDAIKRTLAVSKEIAIYALVVDAIDDKAKRFYEQYDFIALAGRRLFLPLQSF